jgi:hypothetical protein
VRGKEHLDAMSTSCATHPHHAQSEAKRRRLRKGTHSCWECKRRKMKCIFDPTDSTTCTGCQRRGSQCVGQDLPEELSLSIGKSHNPDKAITKPEIISSSSHGSTYDMRTPSSPSEDGRRTGNGIPTPVSSTSESSRHLAFYKSPEVRVRYQTHRELYLIF